MYSLILILSDARGQYIPRDFVTDNWNEIALDHCAAWNVKLSDAEILQNPDHDLYWETWDDVLNYAEFKAENGDVYRLYQDGDLWGICYEKMTDDEKSNFGFED